MNKVHCFIKVIIAIFIILTFLFLIGPFANLANPELYYVPDGYRGGIWIIHGCLNEQKNDFGKRILWLRQRIYQVPPSGIVKTSEKMNYGLFPEGWVKIKFIDKENQESNEAIDIIYSSDSKTNNLYFKIGQTTGATIKHAGIKRYYIAQSKADLSKYYDKMDGNNFEIGCETEERPWKP
ncbi:hypothetical protein ND856_18435 [Leptospira bandrabouensis]|uniref:hypothetical protein n=1 Tax=Leptospira TaxID=171 RepID=UPI000C2AB5E9|nr:MULTISPECIES: hypothetical protein [Leptospira]MCW7459804.1 hypothetical protein [Leptospira bandrabouensis]MCW7479285.1 hypothetical protein [Leptospira bandrabouensis]MCW7486920.1 hypothetical protein [Leptospira bandrabouensis]PKA10531.1 hypothetical protein CH372_18895 [Leptospira meyeri]